MIFQMKLPDKITEGERFEKPKIQLLEPSLEYRESFLEALDEKGATNIDFEDHLREIDEENKSIGLTLWGVEGTKYFGEVVIQTQSTNDWNIEKFGNLIIE